MAKAQKEPSLVQKDVLASKLKIRPDSDWPKVTRSDSLLCEVAKCQLCEIAITVPDIQLYNTVRPKHNLTIARS